MVILVIPYIKAFFVAFYRLKEKFKKINLIFTYGGTLHEMQKY